MPKDFQIDGGKVIRIGAGLPIGLFFVLVGLLLIPTIGCPYINVWQKHKEGEAELAQAESNRQILVQTAESKAKAAEYDKQSKIIEAEGVAQANKIIGDSLKENPLYLTYMWLKGLQDSDNQVIYVATEAGVPITEGHRLEGWKPHGTHTVAKELEGQHVHDDHQQAAPVKE